MKYNQMINKDNRNKKGRMGISPAACSTMLKMLFLSILIITIANTHSVKCAGFRREWQ
jgi:hypothetical protein